MSDDAARRIAFVLSGGAGPELTAGRRDVADVYSRLTDPQLGSCSVAHSPNPEFGCATKADFLKHLDGVLRGWRPTDQLVVYYTGHGRTKFDMYCLTFHREHDEDFPFRHMLDHLRLHGVTRAIIIVDACFSGAAVDGKAGPEDVAPPELPVPATDLPKGYAIVSSSRASQRSEELSTGESSVFTRLFCDGLDSGIGGKATSDKKISVEDMVDYIRGRLDDDTRYAKYLQRPVFAVQGADRAIWLSHNISRGNVPEPRTPSASSSEELRLLYEQTHDNRRPCPGATGADLDPALLQQYGAHRAVDTATDVTSASALRALGLYSNIPVMGQEVLHRSAVLCFAREPNRFIEQAIPVFVDETVGDQEFERNEIVGPLSRQIEALTAILQSRLRRISRLSPTGDRTEAPEIDTNLLRELIANAIIHRDYEQAGRVDVRVTEDYVEIRNPGRLPEPWADMLKWFETSRPVNPAIAYYQSCLPRFEGVGIGFRRIREYRRRHGDKSIVCEVTGSEQPVTLIKVQRPQAAATATVSQPPTAVGALAPDFESERRRLLASLRGPFQTWKASRGDVSYQHLAEIGFQNLLYVALLIDISAAAANLWAGVAPDDQGRPTGLRSLQGEGRLAIDQLVIGSPAGTWYRPFPIDWDVEDYSHLSVAAAVLRYGAPRCVSTEPPDENEAPLQPASSEYDNRPEQHLKVRTILGIPLKTGVEGFFPGCPVSITVDLVGTFSADQQQRLIERATKLQEPFQRIVDFMIQARTLSTET